MNKRQQKVVNRLLDAGRDGFEGGLTNRKYAGMAHVSRATAQRELADLVKKGILVRNPGGGRSVSYALAHFCEMRGSLKGIDTSIERDGDRF